MSDMVSRQAVLKLLSTMPPEEAMTKTLLIQSVKQMDATDNLVKDSQGLAKDLVNDCISRQAAIDAIESSFDRETILNRFVRKIAISAVRNLPSAQPEIIYCRECRHWYTGDGYNHENGAQCELTHMWMGPDDYCSYGRRKVSE